MDDVRRAWLLDRVDRRVAAGGEESPDQTLAALVELVAVATGEAASLRALGDGGVAMHPVAAHHPDPEVDAAMREVMARSVPADEGLWQPVVATRRPHRFVMAPGDPDPQASPAQRDFLRRFPITAVLGVPLVSGERVVGGLALVRFVDPRPLGDAEEELLLACAPRVTRLMLRRDTHAHHGVRDVDGRGRDD